MAKSQDATFVSGSIIYLASNVASAAVPFLLLPILTRVLGPTEYGEVALFLTLMTGLSAIIGLNVTGAANRMYFELDMTREEQACYLGACFQILIISTVPVIAAFVVFGDFFSDIIGIRKSWLFWCVLATFALVVSNIRLGQWQVRSSAAKFGSFQVAQSATNVGLSLLLVLYFVLGAEGRILAQIMVFCSFALLATTSLTKDGLLKFWRVSPQYIKGALRFGIPLLPHSIGGFLLIAFDRIVVGNILGTHSVGIYMVAAQLAGATAILFDALNKAYVPWLFRQLQDSDPSKLRGIVRYTYFSYIILIVPVTIAFLIGPWLVTTVAGDEFSEAGKLFGWLVLGQCLGGMYLTVTSYIFYSKRTGLLSVATICSGFLHVACLCVFVPVFGLIGAGFAFSISMLIRFLITWYVAQICYRMPWFESTV